MRSKVLLLVVFLLWLLTKNAEAAGTIGLPFREGQPWTVCRGYNIPRTEHDGVPVLDLMLDPNSAGEGGCVYNPAVSSAGQEVIAPESGYLARHGSNTDGVCIDFKDGRAVDLLHLKNRRVNGEVKKGEVVGTVDEPTTSNNGIPHIHIQARSGNCAGALRPFTEENGFRFENNPNLPYNGTYNQWAGDSSNPTILQWFSATWHPNGTMVREVATQAVWYLESGVGGGFEGVPAFVFGSPADMPNDYDYVSAGGRQFNVREQFSDISISSDGILRNQRLYEVELRKISAIY